MVLVGMVTLLLLRVRRMRAAGTLYAVFALALLACTHPQTPPGTPSGGPSSQAPIGENAEIPPFESPGSLSDAERFVVQDTLRGLAQSVAIQNDRIWVDVTSTAVKIGVGSRDMEPVRRLVADRYPWLAPEYTLSIMPRAPVAFATLELSKLRLELVTNGRVQHELVFRALISAFPGACGAEIDPDSRKANAAKQRWEFSSIERPVATTDRFKGFRIKERLTVVVEGDAKATGVSPETGVDVILDGRVCWGRLSSREWQCGSSRDAIRSDALVEHGPGTLGKCKKQLLQSIVRDES
jgi:hypothetical protein